MFEQVQPHESWPSGDSMHLAVVKRSPEDFTREFGIRFENDQDDLDEFVLAAIRLSSGNQVWIEQHRGDPESESLLIADIAVDASTFLREVLDELRIQPEEIRWVAPSSKRDEPQARRSG